MPLRSTGNGRLRRRANGSAWAVSVAAAAIGGIIQSISFVNEAASAQPLFVRRGVAFQQAHVPAGSIPVVTRAGGPVSHQWSRVSTYPDGSWRWAELALRDGTLAAGGTYSYDLRAQVGTLPAPAGLTLASVVAAHDLKVVFSNVQQSSDGSTFTSRAASLPASLAAHAAVSTRVTDLGGGAVYRAWRVWGMAGSDLHLKTNWFLIAWLNADGSVYAVEAVAVATQDWWSVANKYLLAYDAAFMDGATTIASYPGVQHPYGSQWATVRTAQDNDLCRAFWVGGAMPSLTYRFDRSYWRQCGVCLPHDLSVSPPAWDTVLPTYVPCRGVASSLDQRNSIENIDGQGAHGTRGLLTGAAATAWYRQGASDYAIDRAQALSLLGAPFHYRSNRTRTRPGEGTADTANSVISLIMGPKAPSEYDFTGDGLPVAVHAYAADGSSYPDWTDGYVVPQGGTLGWQHNYPDTSHWYPYAIMSYLIEGSPWVLESCVIDWATGAVQQNLGHFNATAPLFLSDYRGSGVSSSMPTDQYNALVCYCGVGNARSAAFGIADVAQAAAAVYDGHEAARYLRKLNQQQGDYVAASLAYMPASQKAAGAWVDLSPTGANYRQYPPATLRSPWQDALVGLAALHAWRLTGNTAMRDLGLMVANLSVGLLQQGGYYLSAYRLQMVKVIAALDFTSNNWVPPSAAGFANNSGNVTSGSATISGMDQTNEGYPTPCYLTLAVNDQVVFTKSQDTGDTAKIIPPEVTEGATYYVVNVPHQWSGYGDTTSVQVSATPGGAPIVFSVSGQVAFYLHPASAAASVATSSPYVPGGDCYAFLHAALIAWAAREGHAGALGQLSKLATFLTHADRGSYPPSALAA